MKALKLSALALSLGLFAASCGNTETVETPVVDSPATETAVETPATEEAPATTDSTVAPATEEAAPATEVAPATTEAAAETK